MLAGILQQELLEIRGAGGEDDLGSKKMALLFKESSDIPLSHLVGLEGAVLAGQGDVHEGEILAQLLEHRGHRVLVVVPAQAEVLMSSHGSHVLSYFFSHKLEFLLFFLLLVCEVSLLLFLFMLLLQ